MQVQHDRVLSVPAACPCPCNCDELAARNGGFLRAGVAALQRLQTEGDVRTMTFVLQQLADVVHPEKPEVRPPIRRSAGDRRGVGDCSRRPHSVLSAIGVQCAASVVGIPLT